ncbi:hypothetical protein [Silvibacterium dinghuense]|uniref:Glycerophosphoryl diester phosphodiesterase membrane domain-containing protein n=1 Tax=Silvibacterium dinghuense TaxID=1560006 RepID=A0A4Q1SIS2_9BACT|nr:hypothetical protein [Silvibacterium dinghuense]RXS97307.1 hypothetical protein ESZ00_05200 [Silvibacterium dinghuense]GGG97942.1 hypothetical protein GCM10011586_11590 [Silvibacterium dinghuense]
MLELLWRWSFGLPLTLILGWEAWRIYRVASTQIAAGLSDFTLTDPTQAATIAANLYAAVAPPIVQFLGWFAPLAMAAWAVASGIGRNAVLRRYDPTLPNRWETLAALQLLRAAALAVSVWIWFAGIHWAASATLNVPTDGEPNIVGYFALVVCLSLGVFVAWALASWVFSIAPLLVLLEDRGITAALKRSLRLGPLKGKLVEVNFIMGIVKVILVVLATVFSATPLPFSSDMTGPALWIWWAAVTLAYCVAADFFQVARLVAFLELWRVFTVPDSTPRS